MVDVRPVKLGTGFQNLRWRTLLSVIVMYNLVITVVLCCAPVQ